MITYKQYLLEYYNEDKMDFWGDDEWKEYIDDIIEDYEFITITSKTLLSKIIEFYPHLEGVVLKLSKELQEHIIKNRPDLIKGIYNLDPELKKKYAHELELAGLDI